MHYGAWNPDRPHAMVVACSDGRLQEPTDAFLERELGLTHFDRLYIPGGAGALAASDRDVFRAQQLRFECKYLVQLHHVERVILLFHGPAVHGPEEALCADYRRKMPWAAMDAIRERQARDAAELMKMRWEWAADAAVAIYRCEITIGRTVDFVALDPAKELADTMFGEPVARTAGPSLRSG